LLSIWLDIQKEEHFKLIIFFYDNKQEKKRVIFRIKETYTWDKRKKNHVTVLDNNRLDLVRYWDLTFYDDLKFEKSIRRGSEGACEVELIDER
jgi:hypothetical protein